MCRCKASAGPVCSGRDRPKNVSLYNAFYVCRGDEPKLGWNIGMFKHVFVQTEMWRVMCINGGKCKLLSMWVQSYEWETVLHNGDVF